MFVESTNGGKIFTNIEGDMMEVSINISNLFSHNIYMIDLKAVWYNCVQYQYLHFINYNFIEFFNLEFQIAYSSNE